MSENKQSKSQQPAGPALELQLKAHNILLMVEELGIISNGIQAFGSLVESLGASITVRGNLIGSFGFKMETVATRLHIESSLEELNEQDNESKSSVLLQLKAYRILLEANLLGIMSNDIQAIGAAIQAAAGIIIAFGNLLAVAAFELEIISTRLLILSTLQEIEEQQSQNISSYPTQNTGLDISSKLYENRQVELLLKKIRQLEDNINLQQDQIQKIQQQLNEYKEKQ